MLVRRRLAVLPLIAALLAGLAAPAARANNTQLSVMMDDDNLVYRDDATRDATLRTMKALGVDEVRVTLLWSVVANGARSTKARDRRFRRLGADNPKAYPKLNWDRYDRLVRAGRTLGIGIYFDVTGPGPAWGHETPPAKYRRDRATWKPKPREFKLFVEAVGKRYSGAYRDEDDGHPIIPRVSFWALWNEPNQGGWLTPQWVAGKPFAPSLFRRLYLAGRQGLVATGHGGDTILLGETAPLGLPGRTDRSSMYPETFIRALFCVDGAGNPTGGFGCGDFSRTRQLPATAWAHHPYSKTLPPNVPDPHPGGFTMANIGSLIGLLDQIAAKTGRVAPNLPLALTEFGYETNPPDPYAGVTPDQQATYLNVGDFMAWTNPRVIAQTQFLLKDVPPLRNHKVGSKAYWHTYQSGLFFANGLPKPAAAAYELPLVVNRLATNPDNGHPVLGVWGQLRFRPKGVPDTVQLIYRPADGSADWAPIGDPIAVNGPRNYFTGAVEIPAAGQIRALWQGTQTPYQVVSRVVPVG